jgi:hypothetical protein
MFLIAAIDAHFQEPLNNFNVTPALIGEWKGGQFFTHREFSMSQIIQVIDNLKLEKINDLGREHFLWKAINTKCLFLDIVPVIQ